MKSLSYLLLFCLMSLATSCTEDIQGTERVKLSDEEIAENYLNGSSQAVFFGKVNIDQSGIMTSGWVIDNKGSVQDVIMNSGQQPNTFDEMTTSQMSGIVANGNMMKTLEDKYPIMRNHVDVGDIPEDLQLSNARGESFFAIVPVREEINEVDNCSNNSHDAVVTRYFIKVLSDEDSILNHDQARSTVLWLRSINSELN